MIVYDQYLYPQRPDIDDDVVVYHSGFCSVLPNYSYGRDVRDYYLIHYVTNGRGTYSAGGQTYNLSTHDGFLILPGETIVHTADATDPWNLCWVAFFGRKVAAVLEEANLGKENLLFHYDQDDYLENCIKNIYDESRGNRNLASITGQFWLLMGRLIENNHKASTKHQGESVSFSHFEDALNYLNRHIYVRVTVEELSSYLRLDPSQIYRIFKQRTGLSPQRYITNLRMDKACELLLKTDLPVKDISEWFNFEYQSHFTKQFKNALGVSPTEYRAGRTPTTNLIL